jgi:lambda repressor-like predicted transcriptional regulator
MTPIPATPYNMLGMRALALHKQGKTWAEIAQILDGPVRNIRSAAERMAPLIGASLDGAQDLKGPEPTLPLTRLIHSRGMSLAGVAKVTGIPAPTIRAWGQHTVTAPHHKVRAVAKALGVTVQEVRDSFPRAGQQTVSRGGGRKRLVDPARAYALRHEGLSWPEIGAEFAADETSAIHAAKRYAHKNALPWPPE